MDIFFHLSVLIPQVVTATFDNFEYYIHTYTQRQKFDFLQDDSSESQSHVSIFLLSTFIWMSNLHLNMNIYKSHSWLLLPFNQSMLSTVCSIFWLLRPKTLEISLTLSLASFRQPMWLFLQNRCRTDQFSSSLPPESPTTVISVLDCCGGISWFHWVHLCPLRSVLPYRHQSDSTFFLKCKYSVTNY